MIAIDYKYVTAAQLQKLTELLEDRSFNDPSRYFGVGEEADFHTVWHQEGNLHGLKPDRVVHLKKVVSQHEGTKVFFNVTVVVATEVFVDGQRRSAKVPQSDLLRVMSALDVFPLEGVVSSR